MDEIMLGGVSAKELDGLVQRACDTGNWEELGVSPKSNCKCYTQGHIGKNNGKYVVCRCITRQIAFIRSYVIPRECENAV